MASGRSIVVTGQAGEYLVAAELSRRGLIATTFTANVPHYDIIASDDRGRHVAVQVKTSKGGSWQFQIDHFCKVELQGERQIIGRAYREPVNRLICVLVLLDQYGSDRFFVCTWRELRNHLIRNHRAWLDAHNGVRPRNPESMHTAIRPDQLEWCEGSWGTLTSALA
jgi:hypothetical protein